MSEEEERDQLVKEILGLREEQKRFESQISTLSARKSELEQISRSLRHAITDKATRELEFLDNERIYMSQKSVQDEEAIKKSFEAKLAQVLKQKEDLERRLEAESEFIARNLRERLSQLHHRTLELRSQLSEKVKQVSQTLVDMAPDKVLRCRIDANHDQCLEIAKKIAEGQREIEGLTTRATRLNAILGKLSEQVREREGPVLRRDRMNVRRSSNVGVRRPRRPSA